MGKPGAFASQRMKLPPVERRSCIRMYGIACMGPIVTSASTSAPPSSAIAPIWLWPGPAESRDIWL